MASPAASRPPTATPSTPASAADAALHPAPGTAAEPASGRRPGRPRGDEAPPTEPRRYVPLRSEDPEALLVEAREAAEALRPPVVLVVDAVVLGDSVPADMRVVETMRRAETVVAERLTDTGLRRLVSWAGAELVDAGCVPAGPGQVRCPPADPVAAATDLAEALPHVGIVVAARTPAGAVPVHALGEAPSRASGWLASVDSPAVLVECDPSQLEKARRVAPTREYWVDGRYERARAAFGVDAGTPRALEIGIPGWPPERDSLEARVERAVGLALTPLGAVPAWHPLARLVQTRADLSAVRHTVVQTGVRLDADDEWTLGVATGRLLVALGVEGLTGVPVSRTSTPGAASALVGILTAGETST